MHTSSSFASVVLDTNVVLDWLVFRDPRCGPLVRAVVERQVRWLATRSMRDELADVVGRGVGAAWQPDLDALWAAWDRHATEVPAVVASGAASRLRCTDGDDQMFIDLAVVHAARWLVSRDRAVLKLARRADALGLSIVTPERWAALQSVR